MLQPIHTDQAPAAIGPYSQAMKCGDFLFTSGQIPLDAKTGELVGNDIESQAHQVFLNCKAVLAEAGVTLNEVIKTTVFITDMNSFGKLNAIYAEYMGDHKPARSTVEVSKLPKNVLVEIEMTAFLGK